MQGRARELAAERPAVRAPSPTPISCAGYDASFNGVVYRLDLGPDDVIFPDGFE